MRSVISLPYGHLSMRGLLSLFATAFIACGAAYSGAAWAESDAELVQKISRSVQSLNFEGTYVHQQDGGLYTARVYHRVSANGERVTRVQSLDGPSREVIRSSREMRAYLPEQRVIRIYKGPMVRPDFPAMFVANPSWVLDHYQIERRAGKRIADQETELLVFVPKDHFRWRVHCWVEKRHHLPVKLQLLDPQGLVLEEYAFSEVKINPSQSPQVSPSFQGVSDWKRVYAPMVPKEVSQSIAAAGPMIGFRPVASAMVSEPSIRSVEQYVLSDGLAVVSIFIGPLMGADAQASEVSRKGSLSMVVRKKGSHSITAIGEVPTETVQDLVERFAPQ